MRVALLLCVGDDCGRTPFLIVVELIHGPLSVFWQINLRDFASSVERGIFNGVVLHPSGSSFLDTISPSEVRSKNDSTSQAI